MNECMLKVVFDFEMHHGNLKGVAMQVVKKLMKGHLRASPKAQ